MRCLENSVIATLAEFGIEGFTTENVGVWVRDGTGKGEERKICAIGEWFLQCTNTTCIVAVVVEMLSQFGYKDKFIAYLCSCQCVHM